MAEPRFTYHTNILGTVAGVGGGIPSLASTATSVQSAKVPCLGAKAVHFILSADADPSAPPTLGTIGTYYQQRGLRRTTTANLALDANWPAADISEGSALRVMAASGGANNIGNAIAATEMDVTIVNNGAAAMTNVRLDALVVYG